MIKLAKTEEDWKKCYEYLKSKGTPCIKGTILFFIEKDGIKGVAGYHRDYGASIEPLQAEHPIYAHKLFYFMQGFITGQGHNHIIARTNNKLAQSQLIKDGFYKWTDSIEEFFKEI